MTGYLTGHMYGKLINATYLEVVFVGDWDLNADLHTDLTERPSWV